MPATYEPVNLIRDWRDQARASYPGETLQMSKEVHVLARVLEQHLIAIEARLRYPECDGGRAYDPRP